MLHANTQRLIEDWRARRGSALAPSRSDISPIEFREILPQLFILGREGSSEVFRLVGGLLADLHARDLRGKCFLSLWPYPDRTLVAEALEGACRTGEPAVLQASAWTVDGCDTKLEIVLAPLIGPSGELDRVLGLYQPKSGLRRLMGRPVQELTLREIGDSRPANTDHPIDPPPKPRPTLKLVALDGQRLDR